MGVCGFFLSVKFATSPLASLAGGKNSKTLTEYSYTHYFLHEESFTIIPPYLLLRAHRPQK